MMSSEERHARREKAKLARLERKITRTLDQIKDAIDEGMEKIPESQKASARQDLIEYLELHFGYF